MPSLANERIELDAITLLEAVLDFQLISRTPTNDVAYSIVLPELHRDRLVPKEARAVVAE